MTGLNVGLVFDESRGGLHQAPNGQKWPILRPVIMKAYMCIFMSFTMKAVRLEAVSELIERYGDNWAGGSGGG